MALKCYGGEFQNHPGARQKNPRLKDCDRNEDLCIFMINYDELTVRDDVIPGGSWGYHCADSRDRRLEEFNGDFSEQCIESTKDLTVCNIDILNNFSCRFLNPPKIFFNLSFNFSYS